MSMMQRTSLPASLTVDEAGSRHEVRTHTSNTLTHLRSLFTALLLAMSAGGVTAGDTQPKEQHAGSLVIAGGGAELPEDVHDLFFDLAGGKYTEIVLIPTASERADDASVPLTYFWKHHTHAKIVHVLHTRDRTTANDPAFSKDLENVTGVWIAGGKQQLLADAYVDTLVQRRLRDLLQRGGVIGGTSAGASILTDTAILDGTNIKAQTGKGFGFFEINGHDPVIDQHFSERGRKTRLLDLLAEHPRRLGIGIDENTAFIQERDRMYVRGKGGVSVYAHGWEQVFHSGEDVVIPDLQVAGPSK